MTYITTISLRFKPGTRQDVERVFRDVLVAGRRGLVERGELLSTSLVHVGGDAEGDDYQIISHWASKEAHDRNEDNPQDLAAQRAATPYLLTPRSYKETRHQRAARVLRAALIYGILTGAWLLVYLGSVLLLQMAIRPLTGQTSALAIVASTLGAIAALRPLLRRIQRMIDHRFYRDREHAESTLEDLRAALWHEIDLAHLCELVLTSAQRTVHPTFASLWLLSPRRSYHGSVGAGSDRAQVFGARIISDRSLQ